MKSLLLSETKNFAHFLFFRYTYWRCPKCVLVTDYVDQTLLLVRRLVTTVEVDVSMSLAFVAYVSSIRVCCRII